MTKLSQRALERRIKRQLKNRDLSYYIPCMPKFEDVLAKELSKLENISDIELEHGGVSFEAPLDTIYHANLNLRTAHRVLLRLGDSLSQSYPMLYDHARKIPWELYLGFNKSFSIKTTSKESRLKHHDNIAESLAAAINKRLNDLGLEAKEDKNAKTEIYLRLFQDRATISLNSSGEHLHKRAYRQEHAKAAIRETLAASILLKSNIENFDTVLDPMCGSASFLIEAAQIASQEAPGLRREFAFEEMPFFQESKWLRFKREAEAKIIEPSLEIIGSDISKKNIAIARNNIKEAGFKDLISLSVEDARAYRLKKPNLLIVANLPYGKRIMNETEAKELSESFAQNLKNNFKGSYFSVITANEASFKEKEFKTTKTNFSNGGIKVTLIQGLLG